MMEIMELAEELEERTPYEMIVTTEFTKKAMDRLSNKAVIWPLL